MIKMIQKMIQKMILTFLVGVSFTAVSQSNIFLISLHDHDTIDYTSPVFNWYYTSQSIDRANIKYDFVLTKLNNGQSAESGITVNNPLLRINDIQGFQLVYPFDAPLLEFNNRYGWQIQKTVNGIITEKSEAWEFVLWKEEKMPTKYALLDIISGSSTYHVNGDEGFFFKLNSNYRGAGFKYFVLDEQQEVVEARLLQDSKLDKDGEPVETAQQFHFLSTKNYAVGNYELIVRDVKGNKYSCRFKVN